MTERLDGLDHHACSSRVRVPPWRPWPAHWSREHPTNKRARKRWEKRGLPVLTLHEARHTYASFAIAAGLNAKTLSTYMGHATIAITLDLYGHLMPGAEDEAAGLLDAYFAPGVGDSTAAQTAAHAQLSAV